MTPRKKPLISIAVIAVFYSSVLFVNSVASFSLDPHSVPAKSLLYLEFFPLSCAALRRCISGALNSHILKSFGLLEAALDWSLIVSLGTYDSS